jgi:hypothetical protein
MIDQPATSADPEDRGMSRHYTTCGGCSTAYTGTRAEHCTSCHETFTNTVAGDRHRTGEHGVTTGARRRRCKTVLEMLTAGLIRNGRGYWTRDQGQAMSSLALRVEGEVRGNNHTGSMSARSQTLDKTALDGIGAVATAYGVVRPKAKVRR